MKKKRIIYDNQKEKETDEKEAEATLNLDKRI